MTKTSQVKFILKIKIELAVDHNVSNIDQEKLRIEANLRAQQELRNKKNKQQQPKEAKKENTALVEKKEVTKKDDDTTKSKAKAGNFNLIESFNNFTSLDFRPPSEVPKETLQENKQGNLKDTLGDEKADKNNNYAKGKKQNKKFTEFSQNDQSTNLKSYLSTEPGKPTKKDAENLVNALGKKSGFKKKNEDFDDAFPELK